MKLSDYNLQAIYRKWKDGLEPLECYMRSGPFVSLQTYEDMEILETIDDVHLNLKYKEVAALVTQATQQQSFVIVDIPLVKCVEFAYVLNNNWGIKPILNCNFLFHTYGLVGSPTEIEGIIKYGLNLKEIHTKGRVMLLDYNRYNSIDETIYRHQFNNQYEVVEEDFPDVEMLQQLGIKGIVLLTESAEKEDILVYLDTMEPYFKIEKRIMGE